ncbi:unnamed protein product [Arctia plantaginis]|uniref:Uncharacterized protein n=1 Tax=Arctia plantaginis TaxID=874455 RepID=A0A8S1A064_ARCPL|nr:unnamed protein product [Arctia plantaginis]
MDVHSKLVSSAKSALSFDNIKYYKAEDSGYHTSFTPGSLEQSDLSSDLDESLPPRTTYDVTPNYRRSRFGPLKVHNDISTETRRGIKRPHPSTEVVKHITTIPTPTTLLSGKIESLDVNEDKENSSVSIPPESPCSSNSIAKKKKRSFKEYLKHLKENQENCAKESISKTKLRKVHGCLRDFNNEITENPVNKSVRSPPSSPRSNRFRKFTKSASLDSRLQLSCVKCSHPAKVTEEPTGEEWVECTNVTCAYQFCRSCNCTRHPGKSCFQYDLNAPSPSKRKKCEYAVGTMKSKKNLRRLL